MKLRIKMIKNLMGFCMNFVEAGIDDADTELVSTT